MRMYDKSELRYKDGYIVTTDGEIIPMNCHLVDMFNQIEHDYQTMLYRLANKVKPVDNSPFEFESEHKVAIDFEVDTPELDKAVSRTVAIMDEIDLLDITNKTKAYLDKFEAVVDWVNKDYVVPAFSYAGDCKFDLKYIGNPLKLTLEDIVELATRICNNE